MKQPIFHRRARAWLGALSIGLLSACGGGSQTDGAEATANTAPSFQPTSSTPPSQQTIAYQKEGARLNSEELAQIAKTGVLPQAFDGPLLTGEDDSASTKSSAAQKSAASRTPAYRFFNTNTQAHFFTVNATERDNVIATLPFLSYEGPAFYGSRSTVPGLSPVHRFYNGLTGVHFYTISEAERANVVATLPQFSYEGIAYYASTMGGTGYTPLYRFFYASKGFHFYTDGLAERDNIIATLPQYTYEGIGYYVLSSNWQTPAIPHTGVPDNKCFGTGFSNQTRCSDSRTYPGQDGHRTDINPMSYSGVPNQSTSSCMLDNVTGLVWEVKATSGTRGGNMDYTHMGSNSSTDASGYVNAVNNMNLCGFNDWRLPKVQELYGLVDVGATSNAKITTSAFPNGTSGDYWTSEMDVSGNEMWAVGFFGASILSKTNRSIDRNYVRLVRGETWTGQRYIAETANYPNDSGSNNVAVDRKTGLSWRRCLEGQSWNGSTCNGTATTFNYLNALAEANKSSLNSGWRLPNVKELASLADYSKSNAAIDTDAFPGQVANSTWSSTPIDYNNQTNRSLPVSFSTGNVADLSRNTSSAIRLVRAP